MNQPNYIKQSRVWMTQRPEFNELWVQTRIEEDPAMLGLGDVYVRDSQRTQSSGGRLDLLLQHSDESQRYEVEIQLGATDASHIIRTLEYWDIERRRFPQYDHTGVIIAEEITSRFLNVVSLFNGFIPIIAIQMQAIQVGDATTLVFTKVLDATRLGTEEQDDRQPPADRAYWESRATKSTVKLADDLLKIVAEKRPEMELKYNRSYIGLAVDGQPDNFVAFRPRNNAININVRLPKSDEVDYLIEQSGLETLEYSRRWNQYRIRLSKTDVVTHADLLRDLIHRAADAR